MSDTITLLDGKTHSKVDLMAEMYSDSFYYGYLGEAALSSSACKHLLEGARAYESSLKQNTDTAALRDGRLSHMAVFEPEKFNQLTVIEGTRASKAYKLASQEQGYYNVCTASEYKNAEAIANAIAKNLEASMLIEGCNYEVPIIGEVKGLPFRAKADCIDNDNNIIVDLKTTSDPIANFPYAARKYYYSLQARLYSELFQVSNFVFLVINKKNKDIGVFECSGDFMIQGDVLLDAATDTYKEYFNKPNTRQLIDNYVYRGTL